MFPLSSLKGMAYIHIATIQEIQCNSLAPVHNVAVKSAFPQAFRRSERSISRPVRSGLKTAMVALATTYIGVSQMMDDVIWTKLSLS